MSTNELKDYLEAKVKELNLTNDAINKMNKENGHSDWVEGNRELRWSERGQDGGWPPEPAIYIAAAFPHRCEVLKKWV